MIRTSPPDFLDGSLDPDAEPTQAYSESAYKDFLAATRGSGRTQETNSYHEEDGGLEARPEAAEELQHGVGKVDLIGQFHQLEANINNKDHGKEDDDQSMDAVDVSSVTSDGQYDMIHLNPRTPVAQNGGQVRIPSSATTPGLPVNPFAAGSLNAPGIMGLSQVFKATQAVTPLANKLVSDPPTDRPSPDIYNARHTPAQPTSATPLRYVQSNFAGLSAHVGAIYSSSPKSQDQHGRSSPLERSLLRRHTALGGVSDDDSQESQRSQEDGTSTRRLEVDKAILEVSSQIQGSAKPNTVASQRNRRSQADDHMTTTADKGGQSAGGREPSEPISELSSSSSEVDKEGPGIQGLQQYGQLTDFSNASQRRNIPYQGVQVPMTSARRIIPGGRQLLSQESPLSSKTDRVHGQTGYDVRFSQSSQHLLNGSKSSGSVVVQGTQIEKTVVSSPVPMNHEQSSIQPLTEAYQLAHRSSLRSGRSISPALPTGLQTIPSTNRSDDGFSTATESKRSQGVMETAKPGEPMMFPIQHYQSQSPKSDIPYPVLDHTHKSADVRLASSSLTDAAQVDTPRGKISRGDDRKLPAKEKSPTLIPSSINSSSSPAEIYHRQAAARRESPPPPKRTSSNLVQVPETSPPETRLAHAVSGSGSLPDYPVNESEINRQTRRRTITKTVKELAKVQTEPKGLARKRRRLQPSKDRSPALVQDGEILDSQSPTRPGEQRDRSNHIYSFEASSEDSHPRLPMRKRQRTDEQVSARRGQFPITRSRPRARRKASGRRSRAVPTMVPFKGSVPFTKISRPLKTMADKPNSLEVTGETSTGTSTRGKDKRRSTISQSSDESEDLDGDDIANANSSRNHSVATSNDTRTDRGQEPITSAPECEPLGPIQTTSAGTLNRANRVFALFKGGKNAYYPATCLSSLGTSTCRIRFDDGTITSLHRRDIRRLELRPGDVVKVDLESMRKQNYVIVALKDKSKSLGDDEEEAPSTWTPRTDISGPVTAVLRVKNRDSLRANLPTDEEVVEHAVKHLYIVKSSWAQFQDREHNHIGQPPGADLESPAPVELRSMPGTPKSRPRRSTLATPAYSVTSAKVTSGLFKNMFFAVSYDPVKDEEDRASSKDEKDRVPGNEEKDRVLKLIESNGGTILEDGFNQLFNLNETSIRRHHSPFLPPADQPKPFELKPSATSYGFTCLIADHHSRRAKYLQALALGLPCLSGCWIEHCVAQHQLLPWDAYLLPAGVSNFIRGAVHSRILPPQQPTESAQLTQQLQAGPGLFRARSVLYVAGGSSSAKDRKAAAESRRTILFLLFALGASRVTTVTTNDNADAALTEGRQKSAPWDFVYLEDDKSASERSLAGVEDASPARRAGISHRLELQDGLHTRLVNREFIVQSLISGKLCM